MVLIRSHVLKILFFVLLLNLMVVPGLEAQSLGSGMSFGGSAGLFNLPGGRIGWPRNNQFGFDIGYHMLSRSGRITHIPKIALSLFSWVEITGALDIRPNTNSNADTLLGAKLQLDRLLNMGTSIAVGGNMQFINNFASRLSAYQLYVTSTYSGTFFTMPAETTLFLGKTFVPNNSNSDIDFGMGFDLFLFPGTFNGLVRWVTDFSNFSYSYGAYNTASRGIVNTGIRIDLSRIPVFNNFKFIVDVIITDALDSTRAFSLGFVFGLPVM